MLLETLDIKKNDILIYSENKFDFEQNFKIINKNSASKKPVNIHFSEVGKYISSPTPKNLILYRLVTNLRNFNPNLTQYGFMISVNRNYEHIYYDPIFAIKDLERLQTVLDFSTFRFKIQQIGLTNSVLESNVPNFSEIYYFDLKADEARNQNDRVFAEAIFSISDISNQTNADEVKNLSFPERIKEEVRKSHQQDDFILSEEKPQKKDNPYFEAKERPDKNFEKIEFTEFFSSSLMDKKSSYRNDIHPDVTEKKQESNMSEFLKKQKEKVHNDTSDTKAEELLYMFKTIDEVNNYLKNRASESVILKFKKA